MFMNIFMFIIIVIETCDEHDFSQLFMKRKATSERPLDYFFNNLSINFTFLAPPQGLVMYAIETLALFSVNSANKVLLRKIFLWFVYVRH